MSDSNTETGAAPEPHDIADDLRSIAAMVDRAEAWTNEQAAAIAASHPGEDFVAMLHDAADRLHDLGMRLAGVA